MLIGIAVVVLLSATAGGVGYMLCGKYRLTVGLVGVSLLLYAIALLVAAALLSVYGVFIASIALMWICISIIVGFALGCG